MKKDVKNEIIDATLRLIDEKGSDIDSITVRDICAAAGVASALVNYHFQTKENLIAQCVQKLIGDVIAGFEPIYRALDGKPPEEKLRIMMKNTCAYLATHENISRISMLTDFTHHNPNDNTAQTAAAYYPLMRAACHGQMSDDEVKRRTYLMILAIQGAFLRGTLLKGEIGLDFHDKQQREALVDSVLDFYLSM